MMSGSSNALSSSPEQMLLEVLSMHKRILVSSLFVCLAWLPTVAQISTSGATAKSFRMEISKEVRFQYLLYLPAQYAREGKWPLILYLHGSAQRGERIELVEKYGFGTICQTIGGRRFIVAAPQCPARSSWEMQVENLDVFLDDIIEKYSVDPQHIYLTGFSNGASGVYEWGTRSPQRFAALVPVSGPPSFTAMYPYRLQNTPLWAFQGEREDSIFLSRQVSMIEQLQAIGAPAELTIIPDGSHDPADAYSMQALYDWLAVQRLDTGLSYAWTASASMSGNTEFRLKGFPHATVVALAGSFNGWNTASTIFGKAGDVWICRIDLKPGTYEYKYVVDGEWMTDPENERVAGSGGFVNSVITVQ